MENENLLPEEEVSILTLTDENGEEINFEYLDCIEYNGVEYLILAPEGDEEGETMILEVQPVDEENENYIGVEDEAVLNAVFEDGTALTEAELPAGVTSILNLCEGCSALTAFRFRGAALRCCVWLPFSWTATSRPARISFAFPYFPWRARRSTFL